MNMHTCIFICTYVRMYANTQTYIHTDQHTLYVMVNYVHVCTVRDLCRTSQHAAHTTAALLLMCMLHHTYTKSSGVHCTVQFTIVGGALLLSPSALLASMYIRMLNVSQYTPYTDNSCWLISRDSLAKGSCSTNVSAADCCLFQWCGQLPKHLVNETPCEFCEIYQRCNLA